MSIWKAASVPDQPETTLNSWHIYELPNGDRHLNGWACESREGRASSSIEKFDITTLQAQTSSGRVYRLIGRPGSNSDADYVWRR